MNKNHLIFNQIMPNSYTTFLGDAVGSRQVVRRKSVTCD